MKSANNLQLNIGDLVFKTERLKNNFIKKYTGVICRFGYASSDIENEIKILSGRFKQPASFSDAVWGLFNKKVIEIGKVTPINFELLSNLHFDMSMFLAESGGDPTPALEEAHKYKLLCLRERFSKVKVSCSSIDGVGCQNLKDKVFDIDYALKNKFLPNKNCTSIFFKTGKYPWCTCYYVAVV